MSRLRVRIELNRGGVGVPLNKLASVVQQAQSFFSMLGDDVHIDQSQGEWLGFDFDHESLNFTAEFVGAVTQDQVEAFHAAFDGTTPLRRATIAQFARIADAIGEDEVIGFGLYLSEHEEPGEWRCLSRRDALRIAEEIQVLLGSGQVGQDSHLPVAGEVSTSARYLFGRRDRTADSAKLNGAVREVEASLSKRISRLEVDVADHSNHIHDLRTKSLEAEQSMGRLLSAVEGFCEQAVSRLESVTAAPALSAAAASAGRALTEGAANIGVLPEVRPMSHIEAAPNFEASSSQMEAPAAMQFLSDVAAPNFDTPAYVEAPINVPAPVNISAPLEIEDPLKLDAAAKLDVAAHIDPATKIDDPFKLEDPFKTDASAKVEIPVPAEAMAKADVAPTVNAINANGAKVSDAKTPAPAAAAPKSASPVASLLTAAAASPLRTVSPVVTAAPFKESAPAIWWRSPIVVIVGLGTVVIVLGILLWPSGSNPAASNKVTAASEPVHATAVAHPIATPPVTPPAATPAATTAAVAAKPLTPKASAGATHVELLASEPSWVSFRSSDGTTLLSGMIEPGEMQTVDIGKGAMLRAGNAGGLTIRSNGKSMGPLGPHGAVREVEFRNGDFKLVPLPAVQPSQPVQ